MGEAAEALMLLGGAWVRQEEFSEKLDLPD
jgi:hypothetical protein